MEYAEDIRLNITCTSLVIYYITYLDENSSMKALDLRKNFSQRQTEVRLLKDVIYFDRYLEITAWKSYFPKIER